uniref:Centromere protein X n=1 Tax=Fundulus heteroclitus TaxID=8078 RepID=A0A3Q2QHK2_FUNHE
MLSLQQDSTTPPDVAQQVSANFDVEFQNKSHLISLHFIQLCVTVSGDATLLMREMLKIFVKEAALRSLRQAEAEDCNQVEIEHFEKILPQLLLDF